jgi:hypothetical protein
LKFYLYPSISSCVYVLQHGVLCWVSRQNILVNMWEGHY